MEFTQHQIEVKKLLFKLTELLSRFKIDLHVNQLLNKLSQTENSPALVLPVLTEWISKSVTFWWSNSVVLSPTVVHFVLNFASVLAKSEQGFCALNSDNFFVKIIHLSKVRQLEAESNVKAAFITLLSSFLEHKSGIEWMIFYNFWEDIFYLSLTAKTKESYEFMSKILERTIMHDESFCINVINRLMLPLNQNFYRPLESSTGHPSPSGVQTEKLKPALQLLGHLLQYFLDGVLYSHGDFQVLLIFLKQYRLKNRTADLILIAKNAELSFDVGKTMFLVHFLELYVNILNRSFSEADTKLVIAKIMNNFMLSVSKANFENLRQFCNFSHFYWKLLSSKIPNIPTTISDKILRFGNQFLALEMMPNLCFIVTYCFPRQEFKDTDDDEFRDVFLQKLFRISCQEVLRVMFFFRQFLPNSPNLISMCIKTLDCIKTSRKHFNKDAVIIVFQTCFFTISGTVYAVRKWPQKCQLFLCNFNYFCVVLEVLSTLIEEFSISWRDSVESAEVMAVCLEFVTLASWPAEVLFRALNLINISISKYLIPNLALLVDRTADSTFVSLGPVLVEALCHRDGDVKRSALQVVCSMSRLSNEKFPSLQKILLESNLPALVIQMSLCGESFVRAAAIECLQEMVQIGDIWNITLKAENPSHKMIALLDKSEDILRVEAITFLSLAYQHQKLSGNELSTVYEIMIHSALIDPHWKVRLRALEFWNKVIKNHLQNQGMIDGIFPDVTFSKEQKKIVTLTDSEIWKRLEKVLHQLNSIGCLAMLISIISNDCNMEVLKSSVKITQDFNEILRKYNFQGDLALKNESNGNLIPAEKLNGDLISYQEMFFWANTSLDGSYRPLNKRGFCLKTVSVTEFLHFSSQNLDDIIINKEPLSSSVADLEVFVENMLKFYNSDVCIT